jgi:recombination protein RecT
MSTEQLAKSEPRSVKDYLALPAYKDRFTEVLGKRAPQFLAAITAVSQMPTLKDAEPRSVIASAMVAATLDLPVNPTLGQAYIVAYRDNTGTSIAQFQIGYKGIIQLALRSGQYRRMNAGPVNAEVFAGYDMVGEPSLDWSKFDPTAEVGGYFCAFELLNGFTKVVYWSKVQVENHARRFSKAFSKGFKSSPWFSDFDGMGTKTVVKNALTKWGVLSVEMQKAVVHDQGAQTDVDADVKYVDGEDKDTERMEGDPVPDRPAPPPRAKKGSQTVTKAAPEVVVTEAEQQAHSEDNRPTPAAVQMQPEDAPHVTPETAAVYRAERDAIAAKARAEQAPQQTQRDRLGDGEVLTIEAQVDEFKITTSKRKGADHHYVTAQVVSPELRGQVAHVDGSLDAEGKPIAAWQLDRPVKLTVRGKRYPSGAHINVVEKIEAITEAPAASPQADEDVF